MSDGATGKNAGSRWARLQDIFTQAIDLPAQEQEAFVRRQTADDAALYEEVMELLAADNGGKASNVLTNALGAAIEAKSREHRSGLLGRVLGNYRLTSVLGHGGTGTVYLAERADRQYSAQVAIKIVDSALPHGDLSTRFRAERQILASLNHPNIARLIDAGETPEGQPYLVMEYVHGEPLDRFCDGARLDVNARLELFLQICAAVQYAHQNLVVHRDLKPANILVGPEGSPKLLDFGIAKLMDVGGEAAALLALTRMNDRLLTPEYASPEQILGRPVTTASDVYALGVVLYELLTGMRPYTVSGTASQLELERSICVVDPTRPSVSVRRALEGEGAGAAQIAALADARGLTADRLERTLIGDLDSIIMRALRKEPQTRYSTVEQLAADVRRYLQREPVHARQGNWVYYSHRFVRRHAFGVSASATLLVLLVAFGVAMSIQTQRVAAERDRATQESAVAEQVSKFMLDVFGASDPFETHGNILTARDLLDRAGRSIRGDATQHPEVRARLLEAMGRAYRRQNAQEASVSFLEEALHIRQAELPRDDVKIASVLTELASSQRVAGDLDAASKTLKRALELTRRHSSDQSLTYASVLTNLGRIELQTGNVSLAKQYFEESLAINKALRSPRDPEIANVLLELAHVYMWSDDLQNAERVVRQSVAIYEEEVPEKHPDRVLAVTSLAMVLMSRGRLNEAAPLFERSLEATRFLYGDGSKQVADLLDSLASIRRSQGKLQEAERYAREALAASEKGLGPDHFGTGFYRASLATHLMRLGKYEEAQQSLERALETYAATLPADHQYVASAEHHLGEVLLARGRLTEAEAMLTAAMNRWKRSDSAPWRSARSMSALGEALYRAGRTAEAEPYLTRSYHVLMSDPGADKEARSKAQERVTHYYTDLGQPEKLKEFVASDAPTADPPEG